ncbi:hypothetical protein FEAC_10280 [Ferrimicrobium acidiphilum DSM 19497]|uniref:ArnR1-like winged helix-turn-helix domain-containing protein n=1 Tax=Ferrimicrobium acidiphilum DSM 19497 TaxID=1121877 RepID=A0A0D8FVK2_9ACTN|nr:hypothetical protein [Ferrimicrobium acidiphilum]KJE77313.1 hypothetical protein FEAC_10280 [Ferrimicrobium acidiphilum DSM 19497]
MRSHVALNTVIGVTNKSLRSSVSQLFGGPYSATQMTYALRKLRLKGLITRIPHTNSYTLTSEGIRFAITYTKLGQRILPPFLQPINSRPPPDYSAHSTRLITMSATISNTQNSKPLLENLAQN